MTKANNNGLKKLWRFNFLFTSDFFIFFPNISFYSPGNLLLMLYHCMTIWLIRKIQILILLLISNYFTPAISYSSLIVGNQNQNSYDLLSIILVETMTLKGHSEINWPVVHTLQQICPWYILGEYKNIQSYINTN